jgi:hypothetical protein
MLTVFPPQLVNFDFEVFPLLFPESIRIASISAGSAIAAVY